MQAKQAEAARTREEDRLRKAAEKDQEAVGNDCRGSSAGRGDGWETFKEAYGEGAEGKRSL